jgi:hypothetical protein
MHGEEEGDHMCDCGGSLNFFGWGWWQLSSCLLIRNKYYFFGLVFTSFVSRGL